MPKSPIRILQLIDSLDAGGAERMAVNFANGLATAIAVSGLVVTRREGLLKESIGKDVPYLFLDKRKTIDFKALFRLRKFIKDYQFGWIHAHSSSFFLAVMLKIVMPSIKIVWHDHYGESEKLADRPRHVLSIASLFFTRIIVVNDLLKQWSIRYLRCKSVLYLPNFSLDQIEQTFEETTLLQGITGKRIVCLANLRAQKNHQMLLAVAQKLKSSHPDWTFHLVGKDFEDAYSLSIKNEIDEQHLRDHVYLYGSRNDVLQILRNCEIGILTSSSEGLPVALLEYGKIGLGVVATNVGDVDQIVTSNSNGFLVDSGDVSDFYECLQELINDTSLRALYGRNLQQYVSENFSSHTIIKDYLKYLA